MTQNVPKRAPAQLERHIQALELRKRGKSYVAIGRELGMSTSCACRLVKRTFAAMKGKRDELIDDVTRLELQRLDAQVEALWPDLTAPGDENAQVRATASNALIRIAETRAKLLALFAPERHEVNLTARKDVTQLSDAELEAIASPPGAGVQSEPDGDAGIAAPQTRALIADSVL